MKKLTILLLIFIFTVSLIFISTGCKEEAAEEETAATEEEAVTEEAAGEETAEQLVIGRVLIFEVDNYQQLVSKFAKDFCEENNIELVLNSADADVEKERRIVEDLITRDVDAIIIQAITDADANEMKKLADDAGIPIVFFYQAPSVEPYVHLALTEDDANREMGAACANLWIEEHPDVPIVVGALMKEELENAMTNRHDPFIEGVQSVDPDAEIIDVEMTDESALDLVYNDFEDVIMAHPEINIVCAMNASQSLTAHNVLKSVGRGTPETEIVSGIEGSLDEYLRIVDPESSYKFTVGIKPYDNEIALWDIALKMINGEISIDANERFEVGSLVLTDDSDWEEYLLKQWNKDLEEELAKLESD